MQTQLIHVGRSVPEVTSLRDSLRNHNRFRHIPFTYWTHEDDRTELSSLVELGEETTRELTSYCAAFADGFYRGTERY